MFFNFSKVVVVLHVSHHWLSPTFRLVDSIPSFNHHDVLPLLLFFHFLFFSAFQSLPVPNTTLSLYFVNSLLLYFPIFSVFLSFLFILIPLFAVSPSPFFSISFYSFLSNFPSLFRLLFRPFTLLFHSVLRYSFLTLSMAGLAPVSHQYSSRIWFAIPFSFIFLPEFAPFTGMLCGVTRIVPCPAEPPSQVPPLTPGTNKKIADALMASFGNWNKEQEKRNIPKGETAFE